jgi:hypothetical protein
MQFRFDIKKLASQKMSLLSLTNPFHEIAILETKNEKINNCELRTYNVMGMLVRTEKISNLSSFTLHRNGLNDGPVFLRICELATTNCSAWENLLLNNDLKCLRNRIPTTNCSTPTGSFCFLIRDFFYQDLIPTGSIHQRLKRGEPPRTIELLILNF